MSTTLHAGKTPYGNCAAIARFIKSHTSKNTANDHAVQIAAAGWLVEGDGPDAVVSCAPQ